MHKYLILGCGYTAGRVARALLAAGASVICTNRHKAEIANAECVALDTSDPKSVTELSRLLSPGMAVLYSIPAAESTPILLDLLRPFRPSRFLYISTTGVYGAAEFVDEHTAPAPETDRDCGRLQTERLISAESWPSLFLRSAAIYGPGRGIHTSAHAGVFRPPPGGNRVVSRIHVDDLEDHILAGLRSELTGAFPVADEEPCSSLEVAEWTSNFLGVPLAICESEVTAATSSRHGRRVNGAAYRRKLGLELRYPSYRQGIPASLKAEAPV